MSNLHSESKALKRAVRPLGERKTNMQPQELRVLCEQQEQLILAEYRSIRLDHEFFELVQHELPETKICSKIMRIKEMTNE
jgi:hypothetical protein